MANLTDQQEKFCHEIVKGKSQFAAYQVAYPTSLKYNRALTDTKASMLMANEKIQMRIEALRAPLIRKTVYDALAAHNEAGEILMKAVEAKQFGPAVAAVQLRAKLHGLITEKKEIAITKMDGMDANEKQTLIEAAQAEIERRKRLAGPEQEVTDVEPKGG